MMMRLHDLGGLKAQELSLQHFLSQEPGKSFQGQAYLKIDRLLNPYCLPDRTKTHALQLGVKSRYLELTSMTLLLFDKRYHNPHNSCSLDLLCKP